MAHLVIITWCLWADPPSVVLHCHCQTRLRYLRFYNLSSPMVVKVAIRVNTCIWNDVAIICGFALLLDLVISYICDTSIANAFYPLQLQSVFHSSKWYSYYCYFQQGFFILCGNEPYTTHIYTRRISNGRFLTWQTKQLPARVGLVCQQHQYKGYFCSLQDLGNSHYLL